MTIFSLKSWGSHDYSCRDRYADKIWFKRWVSSVMFIEFWPRNSKLYPHPVTVWWAPTDSESFTNDCDLAAASSRRLLGLVLRLMSLPPNYQTRGLTLLGVFRMINGEYFLTFLEGKRVTAPLSLCGKDLLPPTKMPMTTNKIRFQYFNGSWKPLCVHAPQDKNLCWGKALAEIQMSSSGAAINLEA